MYAFTIVVNTRCKRALAGEVFNEINSIGFEVKVTGEEIGNPDTSDTVYQGYLLTRN